MPPKKSKKPKKKVIKQKQKQSQKTNINIKIDNSKKYSTKRNTPSFQIPQPNQLRREITYTNPTANPIDNTKHILDFVTNMVAQKQQHINAFKPLPIRPQSQRTEYNDNNYEYPSRSESKNSNETGLSVESSRVSFQPTPAMQQFAKDFAKDAEKSRTPSKSLSHSSQSPFKSVFSPIRNRLRSYTVAELKRKLEMQGLSTEGKKEDLVERLEKNGFSV